MTRRIKLEGANKLRVETARTRLVIGGILFAAGFLVIAGRLVELGVVRHLAAPDPTPIAAAEPARLLQRADIVDRNGVLLATNLTTASLFAVPRRVRDPDNTARRLAAILPDLDAAETAKRLRSSRGFVWLKRNLTPRQQFQVNRLGMLGLDFVREQRRVYPHGVLTAHVVGFTGIDNDGLAGVEKSLDAELRDAPAPLRLSLDIRVQQILRAALADQIVRFDAIGGGGIVLDANTGEVVALVSLPDFDANQAGTAADYARFNRVTLGVYELGSIFKVFNHALALESGIVNLDSGYDTTEPLRVARFTISDFHGEKRWLTVPEIFIHSSNIGSAKMAADIGGPAQRAFLSELGLLARTGIELAERGQPIGPAPWRDINTMTIAYGHGIAVTPLHAAAAVGAIVNGGRRQTPTLLMRRASAAGARIVSQRTSEIMRALMRLVVAEGTGGQAAAPGYLVGGKTGTAEKQADGRYQRDALISSFVGVFPIDAPRYVVLAMLDEPQGTAESFGFATGGWTAAPVVSRVITRMAPLLGIAPVATDTPAGRLTALVRAKDRTVAVD